jgi:hypothetical protein
VNWKFWRKPKELVEEEIPWWYGATLQDVIDRKYDVTQLLDEMVEYHQRHNWVTYGGMEPLALLLLIERYGKRQEK